MTKGGKLNTKFMQTLDRGVYQELKALATEGRVTVQEFLRAVVVPEYLLANRKSNRRT